jgi:hypothetical protein
VQRFDVGRETSMHLVALGMGVSLTSEATIANSFPEVEFRPLAGSTDVVSFSGIWSPKNDNPALRRFLSLATRPSKEVEKPFWRCCNAIIGGRDMMRDAISLSFVFLDGLVQTLDLWT